MKVNGETKGFFKPSPAEGGARGAGRGEGRRGRGPRRGARCEISNTHKAGRFHCLQFTHSQRIYSGSRKQASGDRARYRSVVLGTRTSYSHKILPFLSLRGKLRCL